MANFNAHLHIMRHNRDDLSRMGYFGFMQNPKLTVINMTDTIRQRKGFSFATIPWENRTSVFKSTLQRHHLLKPITSKVEHTKLLKIFRVFRAICDWSKLTYFLYGGSLLGSYRHHGLIPRDDGIDVLMNESEKSQIYKHFTNISGYALCTPRNRQWKLFQSDNKSRKNC